MFIYSCINTLLFSLFVIEFYRLFYPNEYNLLHFILADKLNSFYTNIQPLLIDICYKSVYYYSRCQIYFIRLRNALLPHIKTICNTVMIAINGPIEKPNFVLELYNNGKFENHIPFDAKPEKIQDIAFEKYKHLYDFAILSDNSSANKLHLMYYQNDIVYLPSKVEFISMDIEYKSRVYPINLKTESYNHYITNNILNSAFFNYYLTNNHNVTDIVDPFEYKVYFIDHNVAVRDITHNEYIIFHEDDYEICPNDEESELEEDTESQDTESQDTESQQDTGLSDDDFVKLESPKNETN